MRDRPDRAGSRGAPPRATAIVVAASRPRQIAELPALVESVQRSRGLLAPQARSALRSTFVADVARTFAGQGIFIGLQVFATFTVARALLPDAFGLYTASLILIGAVTFAGDLQIQASAVRARGDDRVLAWSAFVWSAALTIAYSLLIVAVAPRLAGALGVGGYRDEELRQLLHLGIVGLVVKALTTPCQVLLLRRLEIRSVVGGQVALAVVNAGLTTVLALLLRSASALAWSVVAGLTAQMLYFAWATRDDMPALRRAARMRNVAVAPFATFGGYAFLLALVTFLGTNVDNGTVAATFGASALGAYAIARNLARWVDDNIATVVTRVLFPTLACDLRLSDGSRRRALLPRVLQVVTACCCITSALIIFVAPSLMPLFLGPRWHVDGSLLQVLACDGFFAPVVGLIASALLSAGRIRDVVACNGAHVGVLLCVLIALDGRAGLAGVALAEVAGAACATVCACFMLWRYVGAEAWPALRDALPWGGVLACTMLAYQGWHAAQTMSAAWLPAVSPTGIGLAALAVLSAGTVIGQSGWMGSERPAETPCASVSE